jgi:ABC-type nickel/cobalt efflux system permease component RcnA
MRNEGGIRTFDPALTRRVRFRAGLRRLVAALGAVVLAVAVPAIALAHPLGNFTINHFAALRVSPERISLDVVIDRAEIPAFQEQQRLGLDANGKLAPAVLERERQAACLGLASDLRLAVDGMAISPTLVAAGLSLPAGAGGLSTMRLVCEYEVALSSAITSTSTVSFEDRSFAERIGWREIVVLGDGTQVATASAFGGGVSSRLTAYPTDLLTQPLDMRGVSVAVSVGGPSLAPWSAPDAQLLAAAVTSQSGDARTASPVGSIGAVPGGIAENLAALVDVQDLTPLAILVSLAIAFALGVIHALSPGHGKTIMAAYLVGAKGSSRQALGLGLAVTVSHTLGVLALAGITLAASSLLPPERLYPILGVVSGGLVIAIGASLLWSRLRAIGLGRKSRLQADDHTHRHDLGDDHSHDHGRSRADDDGHAHPHPHPHPHAPADTVISWRGLIALGLSGGLVPSASALILLLGSIAAGRVAYGLVLVLGFGLGMAVVLAGIGLLIVNARRLVERRPSIGAFRRIAVPVQLATASLVVVLGIVLTGQALTQVL